jgi:protocatechuate 3,4-dioxygenase beta subunit
MNVPKFDSRLGALEAAEFTTVMFHDDDYFTENTSTSATATESLSLTHNLTFTMPNSSAYTTTRALSATIPLAIYDGALNYHDASASTGLERFRGTTVSTLVYPTLADFTAATSGTTAAVPFTASDTFSVTGQGNSVWQHQKRIGYRTTVTYRYRPTDRGDWNGAGAQTASAFSLLSDSTRLGLLVDAEAAVTPNADANVDDTTGSDDEDGVTMPVAIVPGASVTIPVSVFNNNTSGKQLQAWVDFNNDGTFANTDVSSGGERVYNAATTANAALQVVNVTFTVPAGASVGLARGVRFRLSDSAATTPTSTGAVGEIEDYTVGIGYDFGDAPAPYPSASAAAANSVIGLGPTIDYEAVQPADDGADEDGVFQVNQIVPGKPFFFNMHQRVLSGNSYVNVWIDWNRDGDFADAGEQVVTNRLLAANAFNTDTGATFHTINVPATASVGASWMRVRINSTSGASHSGLTTDGEVEDHPVTIQDPINLAGVAWIDSNGDGQMNGTETTLPAVTVRLLDTATSNLVEAALTNASGAYSFTVPPGNYTLHIGNPASGRLTPSVKDIGSDVTDSDFDTSTGLSPAISLAAGAADQNDWDAGFVPVAGNIVVGAVTTLTTTDISTSLAAAKFNPANGPLTAVNIVRPFVERRGFWFQSYSSAGATVTHANNVTRTYTLPDTTTMSNPVTTDTQSNSLSAVTAATPRLATGTTGYSRVNRFGTGAVTAPYAGPLANFTGASGTTSIGLSVIAGVSVTGAGGGASHSVAMHSQDGVIVCYTFTPVDHGDFSGYGAAYQQVSSDLRLGTAATDAEASTVATSTATADDTTGVDDEDTSVPNTILVGTSVSLSPTAYVNTAALVNSTATLRGFIDWNGDGDVADAGETIIPTSVVSSGTTYTYPMTLTCPAGTSAGVKVLRLRITEGSTAPTWTGGSSLKGEVEDYPVFVTTTLDFGDAPDTSSAYAAGNYQTNLASNGARHGIYPGLFIGTNATDAEADATPNAGATGDNTTGTNDEDGVTSALNFTRLTNATASVRVTNTTGFSARLFGWIDFNGDGWFSAAERADVAVPVGTSGGIVNLDFGTVPYGAVASTFARFRLSSDPNAGDSVGAASDGEVEDHAVTISGGSVLSSIDIPSASGSVVIAPADPNTKSGFFGDSGVWGAERDVVLERTLGGSFVSFEANVGVGVLPPYLSLSTGAGDVARVTVTYDGADGNASTINFNGLRYDLSGTAPFYLELHMDNHWLSQPPRAAVATLRVYTDAGNWSRQQVNVQRVFADGGPLSFSPVLFPRAGFVTGGGSGVNWANVGAVQLAFEHLGQSSESLIVRLMGPPVQDFGDHLYGAGSSASQVASNDIRIGTNLTDKEAVDPSNAGASMDDTTGTDDEDLTMPTVRAGGSYTLTVPVTVTAANLALNTARLGVFVDWNGDNDVLDAGETLPVQTVNASGNVLVTLAPPLGTTVGTKYLRLRLTEGAAAPAFTGHSLLRGEVEDYAITVEASARLGNLVFLDANGNGLKDATETGLSGLTVQLWTPGPNNTEENGGGDDVKIGADITTDASGGYLFPALSAGSYYVRIPTPNPTYPLATISVNADNGINDDSNGVQSASGAAVRTPIIALALGTEPAVGVDGDDTDGDMTVDIGFVERPTKDFGDHSAYSVAASTVSSSLMIGASTDAEAFSTNNPTATGDDITGMDDEEGVLVPANMTAGLSSSITVNVRNTMGAPAYLNAWLDFNNDGDFADAGEQISTDQVVSDGTTNGSVVVPVNVPASATLGTTGLRVRLTSAASPGPVGVSSTGEVEDWTVDIVPPVTDFGDFSGFPSAGTIASSTIKLGATAGDTESVALTNATATGDDSSGSDDEDDVTVSTMRPGQPASVTVKVHNTSGGTAYLNVWIDFNNNGTIEAGETVGWVLPVPDGTILQDEVVNFTVPASATVGQVGMRMRISSSVWSGFSGTHGSGEVEDMLVSISSPNLDFGDLPDTGPGTGPLNYETLLENNGPRHSRLPGLSLGTNWDAEAVALQSGGADGDDADGMDDEDGISTLPTLVLGGSSNINVSLVNTTAGSARLNAWVDFNSNGSFADPGEQVAVDQLVPTGATSAVITVNTTIPAIIGTTGFRVRLSQAAGVSSLGDGGAGEVEDYMIGIGHPVVTVTPLSPTLPDAHIGYSYNLTFGQTGAVGVVSFSSSVVPPVPGLTLNSTSGLMSGTPTTAGTYTFRITASDDVGSSGFRDYTLVVRNEDSGDYSLFPAASSVVSTALRMGALVDNETGLAPNSTADADDTTGTDDEDGVPSIPNIADGNNVSVSVRVTNTTGSPAYLNFWIDYNNNGILTDPGEHILVNGAVANGSTNVNRVIAFDVPAGTPIGVKGMRLRLTSVVSPGPDGLDGVGEVEDYLIQVVPPVNDYGDYSPLPWARSRVVAGVSIGDTVDAEGSGNANIMATGDDITGADDEDGILLPATLVRGGRQTIGIILTNLSSQVMYLNAWIDYNNDGIMTDATEQVAVSVPVAANTARFTYPLIVNVPWTAALGDVGMRVRFCSAATPGIGGSDGNGEVEDTLVNISLPNSLGSRVWIDTDGDGQFDFASGELPLDGVTMNLYQDVDGNGSLSAGDGSPIATQTTYSGGQYRFRGLPPGDYIVEVAASNFATGGILEGFSSSPGNPDPDDDVGSDDNGAPVAGYGVASQAVTLTAGGEPTTDGDGDSYSNLTVDFGFAANNTLAWDVLVPSNDAHKVTQFTWPYGKFAKDFVAAGLGGLGSPYDTVIGPGGDLFVASHANNNVLRYDGLTGASMGTFVSAGSGGLSGAYGLTFGPDGHLYIASRGTNEVKRYNGSTGAFIDNFITTSGGLNMPHQGILWSPDNRLYVSNFGSGQLRRYDVLGTFLDSVTLPGGVLNAAGFCFAPDGNIYLAANNGNIYKVTTGASMTVSVFATLTGSYAHVTTGPDGHLYATSTNGNNVRRVHSGTGANLGVFSTGGSLADPKETVFYPRNSSLTLGNLVFNDLNNNGIFDSATETGINGVTVQLLNAADDAVVGTTATAGGGLYSFSGLLPGNYKVRVPAPPSATGLGSSLGGTDDGTDNDNNGVQPGLVDTAVTTGVVALSIQQEPGSTGVTNVDNTIDIGLRPRPVITVSPSVLPDGKMTVPYTTLLTATNGEPGGYTWAVTGGSLPPGLTLDSTTGEVAGTPTAKGNYTFTATATDTKGCTGSRSISVHICSWIDVTPLTLTDGLVGHPHTQATAFSATGGTAPYTFTVTNLPTGLTFNSSTRKIEGTATALGTWNLSVTATDADGCSNTITPSLTIVCPPITILPSSLPDSSPSRPYVQPVAFSATNGTSPYTWSVTGVPAGMTFNSTTLKLTGTPTAAPGYYPVSVTATDLYGCQGNRTFNLRVCPVITLSPATLPWGYVGTPYSQPVPFSAGGGQAPYVYSATNLPPGLSLDTVNRVLTGTPTTKGTFIVEVTAMDVEGCYITVAYPVKICPIITISPSTLPDAFVGHSYEQGVAFSAAGGDAPYTISMTGLPSGLTYNATSGMIEGTPDPVGLTIQSYTIQVTAIDSDDCDGHRSMTLRVVPPLSVGNLVWLDEDDDGIKDGGEQGIPDVTVQLWSAGPNTQAQMGAGDDVMLGSTTTAAGGHYAFNLLKPQNNLYVMLPTLPRSARLVSKVTAPADNGVDDDNNGTQPSGANTPVATGLFSLVVGSEPGVAVDGDDANTDSTIDIGLRPNQGEQVVFDELKVFNPPAGDGDNPGGIYRWWDMRKMSTGEPWRTGTDATAICVDPARSYALAGTGYFTMEVNNIPALTTYYPASAADRIMAKARIHWLVDNYWETWITNNTASQETWLYMREVMREIIMDAANGFDLAAGSHQFPVPALVALTTAINAVPSTYRSENYVVGGADPDGGGDQSLVFVSTLELSHNMVIGSQIWNDANDNGIRDASESPIAGVRVDLYYDKDGISANGREWRVGTMYSDSLGRYCFNGLSPGNYEVVIPASNFVPGGALITLPWSSSVTQTADNQQEGDDNGIQVGGKATEVRSPVINLAEGMEPGAAQETLAGGELDDGMENDGDMTIGFGFFAGMRLGGTVWADVTENGLLDPVTDTRVMAVTLDVWSVGADGVADNGAGDDVLIDTTASDFNGNYLFTGLSQGGYYVRMVSPPAAYNAPAILSVALDNRIDGDNNALQPGALGSVIVTPKITLTAMAESTTDGDDANGDLTVDLGLWTGFHVGNAVWFDANNNATFGSGETGLGGLTLELLSTGADNAIGGSGADADTVVATTVSGANGSYDLSTMVPGYYYVRINTPPAAYPLVSSVNVNLDNGVDHDNNGYQAGGVNSLVTSPVIQLTKNSEPGATGTKNTENTIDFGFRERPIVLPMPAVLPAPYWGADYNELITGSGSVGPYSFVKKSGTLPPGLTLAGNGALTGVCSGTGTYTFVVEATDIYGVTGQRTYNVTVGTMTLGDLVWNDSNNNGLYEAGTELGIGGIPVTLYKDGGDQVPGSADDVAYGAPVTTSLTGAYFFTGLPAGRYYVTIPAQSGFPYVGGGAGVSEDNEVNNDNNALQPGGPGTAFRSAMVHLEPRGESATDGDSDTDTERTLDLGLYSGGVIGDLVFNDADNSSTFSPGDSGLENVQVELFSTVNTVVGDADDLLVATMFTGANGAYAFSALLPGRYYVRATPPSAYPLVSMLAGADNAINNDNNATQPAIGQPATTMLITYTAGDEPGTSGGTNTENTIDIGFRAATIIDISPPALPFAYVSAPYSQALTASGGTAPYSWSVSSGTLPAWLTLNPTTGVLSGTPPATAQAPVNFTVRATDASFVPGDQDYTIQVKALSIGNLVWHDANYNGLRDAGELGVPSVPIFLFDVGPDNTPYSADDIQVRSSTTTLTGAYLFNNLPAGDYYVKLSVPPGYPLTGGAVVNLDNSTDGDNNALQPGGKGTPYFSPVINLTGSAETVAEDGNPDTDLTVDFGLFPGMKLGNLVWHDENSNGLRESLEPGVEDVKVQVFSTGADGLVGGVDDRLVTTVTTDENGIWLATELTPGNYYMKVQDLPWWAPLSTPVTNFMDDAIDNDDNGVQIGTDPIYSPVIDLAALQEGGDSGNENLTVDFGLNGYPLGGFVTATLDDSLQVFDPATGTFSNMLRDPFGTSHNQGDGVTTDLPSSIETGPDGFLYVAQHGNIRRLSPAGADLGAYLSTLPGLQEIAAFTFAPDGSFLVLEKTSQRVVRFHGPLSANAGQPMDPAPYVFISENSSDISIAPDGNIVLVAIGYTGAHSIVRYDINTGTRLNTITTPYSLASVVVGGSPVPKITGIDIQGNTLYGINETDGEVFSVNLTNPASAPPPLLVGKLSSASMGTFETGDIEVNPSNRQLYIAGYKWQKPVQGGTRQTAAFLKMNPAQAPNAVPEIFEVPMPTPPGPNEEIWPGPRDMNFAVYSVLNEPITSIGNLVWNDLDEDGVVDANEPGIASVKVELYHDANNDPADGAEYLVGWTYTDLLGHYVFNGLKPGDYQVVIPVVNFDAGGSLYGFGASSPVDVTSDNQADNDDNGLQLGGSFTEARSPIITLTYGGEPTGNAVTGTESGSGGDLDDRLGDANGDMTVDFGFIVPGPLGIGNLVFEDRDADGVYDMGEGIENVVVQLYVAGKTPGVDLPVAQTVTDADGLYRFRGLVERTYFVHIPASQFGTQGFLHGLFSIPGTSTGDDDTGEDGIDAANSEVDGISSGNIQMTEGTQPDDSDGETGFHKDDDAASDRDVNLTIDFGFYRRTGIGNFVFFDLNNDGVASDNEGVDGVQLDLYDILGGPGISPSLATAYSSNGGRYLFDNVPAGAYIVHIPAEMFQPGGPLFGLVSILEGNYGDDDVGEDGLNITEPALEGVFSNYVFIDAGLAPTDENGETGVDHTSDNNIDAAVDLTIDFGFQIPLGIGNLVFKDLNGDGVYTEGVDEGAAGVILELYQATDVPGYNLAIASTLSEANGRYRFDRLSSGAYFVHVPASNFNTDGPLYGLTSVPGVEASSLADDSVGENGVDSPNPMFSGISSSIFSITPGNEPLDSAPGAPTGENGFMADEDSPSDEHFDLTVDFGFVAPNPYVVGVGNTVFNDLNGNGRADAGEGVAGVQLQLFPGTETSPLTATPLATTSSSSEGSYFFGNLTPGSYLVFIPPSNFQTGGALDGAKPLPGQGSDDGVDDSEDENGDDPQHPEVSGVKSNVFELTLGGEPTESETGQNFQSDTGSDENIDLTIDFGFFTPMGVGNLVFVDINRNGVADEGEGLGGVLVELYQAGGTAPKQSVTTSSDSLNPGRFMFTNVRPGSYYLHIPTSQFEAGGSLFNMVSLPGHQADGDDSITENGIDSNDPTLTGISTDIFTLLPGTSPAGSSAFGGEPGQFGGDDDGINGLVDANTDLTQDFGFIERVGVGNLIFRDNDGDGKFTPGIDEGVDEVAVHLYRENAAAEPEFVSSVVTEDGGLYRFFVPPGDYYVHVPHTMFEQGAPLFRTLSSVVANQAGVIGSTGSGGSSAEAIFADDDVGEDGIDELQPELNGVRTPSFQLALNLQPTSANTETGYHATDDDGANDDDVNLTVDLGFTPLPISVGNLVFRDSNANGIFDPGVDVGVPGVKVELFTFGQQPEVDTPIATTLTQANGFFMLSAFTPAGYFLHVPASEFQPDGPLYQNIPATSFGTGSGVDDDADHNTLPSANPAVLGVNSTLFTLDYGTEPVGETGFSGSSDDNADSSGDMTIDLAFVGSTAPPPNLRLGNIVYIDANADGSFTQGEGVDGVWMLLYAAGEGFSRSNPVGSTFTSNGGRYMFSGLRPGSYIVHVAADNFKPAVSLGGGPVGPGPLYNHISLPGAGVVNADLDDHVDEDGIDVLNPEQVGTDSRVVFLSVGEEPTAADTETGASADLDDDEDANGNMTVDFGFTQRMVVGNLVFKDVNRDGVFTAGVDHGVSGVSLHLFRVGDDPLTATPVDTTSTATNGSYLFTTFPGEYFIYVPGIMFSSPGPLTFMQPTALSAAGDDNQGQNVLPGSDFPSNGARTAPFTLIPGAAPIAASGQELGFLGGSDDGPGDFLSDLTVDLGFAAEPLTVGNLVFKDNNANGKFDSGDTPVSGVRVDVLVGGSDPYSSYVPRVSTTTASDGSWQVLVPGPGVYFAFIPPSEFAPGKPLYSMISSPGAGTGGFTDDDGDENGLDQPVPAVKGIASEVFSLTYGNAPLSTGTETGYLHDSDIGTDESSNLTIDFGFIVGTGVGNLVFKDNDSNTYFGSGDVGVAGVKVSLYRSTDSVTSHPPLTSTTTDSNGRYMIVGIAPGSYFLHIPATSFFGSAPLYGLVSSVGSANANGDDNVGENGLDSAIPVVHGISTSPFTLTLGGEPIGGQEGGVDGSMDDSISDSNIDLTQDFGFIVPSYQGPIAGQVMEDSNNNNDADAGDRPLAGVEVSIYADSDGDGRLDTNEMSALSTVLTNAQGRFTFDVEPGAYLVVSSVLPGAEPTYDTDGGDPTTTRVTVGNTPVTGVDFAQSLVPTTFTQWLIEHGLSGENIASGNADADGASNLLEYALGTDPDSGLASANSLRLVRNAASGVDAVYRRPVGPLSDVRYLLQAQGGNWTTLALNPVVTPLEDGLEEVRYVNVQTASAFSGQTQGRVRLLIELDADLNGSPEATTTSAVQGFGFVTFTVGQSTFSQPLLRPDVFTGTAATVTGNIVTLGEDLKAALTDGEQYWMQVLSGALAGHRIEIDEANSQGAQLHLLPQHAGSTAGSDLSALAGARLALRPHQTLSGLMTTSAFTSAAAATDSDRVLFFQDGQFVPHWLSQAGVESPTWSAESDATQQDAGGRVVMPLEGMMIQIRHTPVTLPFVGEVPAVPMAAKLNAAVQLMGSPSMSALTTDAAGFTVAEGFVAGAEVNSADRLRHWLGDSTAGASGYHSYFLGASGQWMDQTAPEPTPVSSLVAFRPFRASFVITSAARVHLIAAP